jgi:uncharacterized protein YndB with AHSA1/START domain
MANDFEVGIDVFAPPDEVWTLAGDPVRIIEWFDPVAEIRIEDDRRIATMGNGAVLVERLTDRDDAARTYSYEVMEGIPGLTSHRATIRVEESPAGSRVLWRQVATSDVEGYDIEARLAGVMSAGLANLKAALED